MSDGKTNFSLKDLECEQVVIFQDRAEVKRVLKTSIQKGEHEIVLSNVTSSIDKDSVRVEGKGNACVLDVICESKSVVVNQNETNEKLKEAKLEIKQIENKIEKTKLELERISKKAQVVNEFANTLSKATNTQRPELNSGKENVDNFLSFIDLYSSKLEMFDQEKLSVQKNLSDLEDKLKVANSNHDQLSSGRNFEQNIEITIVLETGQQNCDIQLNISYLVYNASWAPKYDIRVNGKEKSMIINYFGLIKQTTDEDWNDTKVSLSTAVPSIGGNVPELPTQYVRIRYVYNSQTMNLCTKSYDIKSSSSVIPTISGISESSIQNLNLMHSVNEKSSIGSTSTFNVPRKANIPSDGKTHKVSIAILNLSPEFEYETVPRMNTHAFIKAKVINTSEYALLAGPANVFLDNNFVAKTNLKAYSPQEELDLSLGVDPAIRIDYKPVKKYTTQHGLVSRTSSTTYVQIIEIKNTGQSMAKILLIDNLPLSCDDKVEVKLMNPNLKNHPDILLNKENNLEFRLEIQPGKREELSIKYSIEFSSHKEVEFY